MTLLKEGIIIMVIGMGTVFFFLTIMIGAMNINEIVLKFIGKFFPEEVKASKAVQAAAAVDQNIQEAINKAILAISGGKKQAQKIEKI